MNFPYSSEAVIGLSTLVVVLGTFCYFQMGGGTSKQKSGQPDHPPERESERVRSYSNIEEKYPAGKMSIYFGSQTGTAEGFARVILSEAHKSGFEAKLIDLEDFEPEQLKSARLAIFLVATYGEGDPTDNAARFCEWASNENGEMGDVHLSGLNFSVFGLGNSQYENFNKIGRNVNESLEKLGASRAFEYMEGDDDATLEDDFENWKAVLIPALVKTYHPSAKDVEEDSPSAKFRLKAHLSYVCKKCDPAEPVIPPANIINTSTKYFFTSPLATLSSVREMRSAEDGGNTIHMELDVNGTGLSYVTADNLAVIPENASAVVDSFAKCGGGFDLDQYINIEPIFEDDDVEELEDADITPFKHPFPTPCTVRDVFTKYLDIDSIPRRSNLERLCAYLVDDQQKAWLKDMVSKEKRKDFQALIEDAGRSYASLLARELSSCRIPMEDLLHIVPFIQPRFYTISSSSSCHPTSVHLTVSVLKRTAPDGSEVDGLCSNFLWKLPEGHGKCRVFARDSLFRLPESVHTPIVMIGPGSGIAPMRGLLQERKFQAEKQGVPASEVTNVLYFGCKSRALDFLYKEELQASVDEGHLSSLKLAFSREQEHKVYVQNLMMEPENAEELARLVKDEGAHVFVCGGTGMGATVHEKFIEIMQKCRGMSADEAAAFIKEKQKNKFYKQELWSV